MTTKLKNFYQNLTYDGFKKSAVIICFVADVLFYIFIKTYILNPESLDKSLSKYLPTQGLISSVERNQMIDFVIAQVSTMIIGYFAFNLITYVFFLQEKKWAIKYISKGTALFGIIFSIFTVYEAYQYSTIWALIMITLIPAYFFVWRGCAYFFTADK